MSDMDEQPKMEWLPLPDDGPELERVLVAGWQEPSEGGTRGYWWYHEDVIMDGKASERPYATLWHPIVKARLPDGPPEK